MRFKDIKFYQNIHRRHCVAVLIVAFSIGYFPGLVQSEIRLISPGSYEHIYGDSVVFQWMHRPLDRDSIQHYEIQFWSSSQLFRKSQRVSKIASETGYFQYSISPLRQMFRRHGQYFWRVSAITTDGDIQTSDTRPFIIPTPELSRELNPWFFPYEIQWQAVEPVETADYQEFIQGIQPASYLKAYSNISLIFCQDQLLKRRFRLAESVFIHSQIGLGGAVSAQLRIMRNRFVALYPDMCFQISKFSTGIGPYSTLQYEGYLGGSLEIMPQSLIVLNGGWIPTHHVRYQTIQGQARSFTASGWEIGFRFLIPKSMVKPFKIFGLMIDTQRFPIVYQYREVLDSYSDLKLRTRRFGIGYLFR